MKIPKVMVLIVSLLISTQVYSGGIGDEIYKLTQIHRELSIVRNMLDANWKSELMSENRSPDTRIYFRFDLLRDDIDSQIKSIEAHIALLNESERLERFNVE